MKLSSIEDLPEDLRNDILGALEDLKGRFLVIINGVTISHKKRPTLRICKKGPGLPHTQQSEVEFNYLSILFVTDSRLVDVLNFAWRKSL